jgi:hypothetical protein
MASQHDQITKKEPSMTKYTCEIYGGIKKPLPTYRTDKLGLKSFSIFLIYGTSNPDMKLHTRVDIYL